MHIERLEVGRFGGLTDITIEGLEPGVQVLHGTNEVGKTSLLEFVRAMFFGFEGLFRRGVLDPRLPCTGRLVLTVGRGHLGSGSGRRLLIERRHEGPHLATLSREAYEDDVVGLGGDEGDAVLIQELDLAAGDPGVRQYLQDIVGEIDERTFTNVMAFGLDELHELRTLEPEGCGSRLYELANGLDRSKVARTLTHLDEAIARLSSSDPTISPLADIRSRRADAVERLAGATPTATSFGDLLLERSRLAHEIDSLRAAEGRADEAEALVRAAVPVAELHAAWREATQELDQLSQVSLVHPDFDGWKQSVRKRDRAARFARRRKRTRSKLARALAALPAETVVWRQRAAITALADEQQKIERLASDLHRAEAHARLAARRFGEQIGLCGLSRVVQVDAVADQDDQDVMGVLLPEGLSLSFGPLRSRARECTLASKEVSQARRSMAEVKTRLEEAQGSLAGAESALGGMTVAAAIESATERATTLRQRITSGDQLAELDQACRRLESELGAQAEGQLMPLGWMLGLGAVFVLGAGMLLSGLLLPSAVTGPAAYALAALGLAGTGLASVMTWSLDRSASERLEGIRRRYALAAKQRDETAAQCETLDRHCLALDRKWTVIEQAGLLADPATKTREASLRTITTEPSSSLSRRAALAEADVERLEAIAAREGSMHVFADRVALAKRALQKAIVRRKTARQRWQRGLESRGLPTTLSPSEVWRIGTHRLELLNLDEDRRRLSAEARQKREELAAYGRRIESVLTDCDLVSEGSPLESLRLLIDQLEGQAAIHQKRAIATRRLEKARIRHRQALREVEAAERGVLSWFARWEVTTAEDFLEKVDRRPLFARTREGVETAEQRWLEARARFPEPLTLDSWMAEAGQLPLERRLADAETVTARLRDARQDAEQRLAAAGRRLDAAAKDRGQEALQRDLAQFDLQTAGHERRLEALLLARSLLEETRSRVAREHQPVALREASHWLTRLTEGRYTRITTAVDEPRLDVHDADDTVWNPERLSRGTREQVFLALRLALVRDLQRHGISLPLVMDDALVNFDDERAAAAARVLVEFMADQAPCHQMLVLTCHAHVAALFASVGGTVRRLDRQGSTPPVATLEIVPPRAVARTVTIAPATSKTEPPAAATTWPAEAYFFGGRPSVTRPAEPHAEPSPTLSPKASRRGSSSRVAASRQRRRKW